MKLQDFINETFQRIMYYHRDYSISFCAVIGVLHRVANGNNVLSKNDMIQRLQTDIFLIHQKALNVAELDHIELCGALHMIADQMSEQCRKGLELPGDEWKKA